MAVKMLAQASAPSPVAGGKKPRKVAVRRLVFRSRAAALRYKELRQKVRDGKLMYLEVTEYDGLVVAFLFRRWGEKSYTEESTDIWR